MPRWLAVSSIALNLGFAFAAVWAFSHTATLRIWRDRLHGVPAPPTTASYRQQRLAFFQAQLPPPGCWVFAGDSQIALTDWFDLLSASVPAINRGISTERIDELSERLPEIARLRPATLVLMTGVNDLSAGTTPAEFAASYDRLLERARTLAPEARLIVNGLLPVNTALNKRLTIPAASLPEANRLLAQIAARHGAIFVDLQSRFTDHEANLRRDLTFDGLHLTTEGYLLWTSCLAPYLPPSKNPP